MKLPTKLEWHQGEPEKVLGEMKYFAYLLVHNTEGYFMAQYHTSYYDGHEDRDIAAYALVPPRVAPSEFIREWPAHWEWALIQRWYPGDN